MMNSVQLLDSNNRIRSVFLGTHGRRRHSLRSVPRRIEASESKKRDRRVKASKKAVEDSNDDESAKVKVAAKISAARSLARKLSEEKAAAAAAAELMRSSRVDEKTGKELKLSAEYEVAAYAKEAGTADAAARQARSRKGGATDLDELERLKRENEKLQELVMQLARDREEAQKQLQEIGKEKKKEDAGALPRAQAAGKELAMEEVMEEAHQKGERIAVVTATPGGRVSVGSEIQILYDSAAGPLPKEGMAPVLKIGYNRWESQEKVEMKLLEMSTEPCSWYTVTVPLPALLYRVDFVVEDSNSGAVDNNGGQDFTIDLDDAPTAEEVTASRVALLEKFERKMRDIFDAEEDEIYENAMKAAKGASKEARLAYVASRKEQILQEAQNVVAERRNPSTEVAESIPGVFQWSTTPKAGSETMLLYNKASGTLKSQDSVVVHVGYDGWWLQDTISVTMEQVQPENAPKCLSSDELESGDWYQCLVPVWNTAATLDFAFSNGSRQVWDNQGGSDFHTPVANAASRDMLVELVFQALQSSDMEDSAKGEEMAVKRVLQRASIKAQAARKRRELQRNFLFCVPMTPEAGKKATIYYNPDRTVLRGRPEVYMAGSFNRGKHPEKIKPVLMDPAVPDAGGLGFQKAIVDIPSDANVLDLTFQDSADRHGGFNDDNKGLGFHLPVKGSIQADKPLFVAHIASEMAPIAKAGGLGDVVTALGRAVQEEGHDVEVVIPKYDCIDYSLVEKLEMRKEYMWEGVQVKVWEGFVEGLRTTFLEPCNGLFWVGSIYTNMNSDRHRFGVFCACALHYLQFESRRRPDLLHCHDWQSAPIAYMDRQQIPCAFTIHNMDFGADLISQAVSSAQVSTTVSPTYAIEIGGHPGIAPHHAKFYGIRNGIDMDIWDPSSDPWLPVSYTDENVFQGKLAAKQALRDKMNLADGDVPIVGCVTRLTHQKGIHLIKHAAWRAMERGAQFVLLGSAPDPAVQAEFNALAEDLKQQYPDRARLWFAYDEPLSHLIFAGCDFFLVPSMFEPCGLTQMIAMRYGTVPIVRRTGGLADTVFDVDDDEERAKINGLETNGYSFDGADPEGLDYALNRALSTYFSDRELWEELSNKVMLMDWSWASPAQDYIQLYYKAMQDL